VCVDVFMLRRSIVFLILFPCNHQVVVVLCFEDVVREKTKVKKAKKKTKRDKLSANAPDAVVKY